MPAMRHAHLKNPEAPGSEINHSNQLEAEAAGADAASEGSIEVDDIRAKLMARIDSDLAKQNAESKSSDRLAQIAKRRRSRKPVNTKPPEPVVTDDPGFGPNLEMVSEPPVAEARPALSVDEEADDEPSAEIAKADEIWARIHARVEKSRQAQAKLAEDYQISIEDDATSNYNQEVKHKNDALVFDTSDSPLAEKAAKYQAEKLTREGILRTLNAERLRADEAKRVEQELREAQKTVEASENRFLSAFTVGARKLAEAAGSLWATLRSPELRQQARNFAGEVKQVVAEIPNESLLIGGAIEDLRTLSALAGTRRSGDYVNISAEEDDREYVISGHRGVVGSSLHAARDIAVETGKAWIFGGFAKEIYGGLREAVTNEQHKKLEAILAEAPEAAPEFLTTEKSVEAPADETETSPEVASWAPQVESVSEDMLRDTGKMFEVMGAQFEMPEGVGADIDISKFDEQVAEAAQERNKVAAEEAEQIATEVGKAKHSWWEKSRVAIESYYDALGTKLIDKLSRKKTLSPEVAAKVGSEPPAYKNADTEKDWAAKRIRYNQETVRKLEDLLIDRRISDAMRRQLEGSIQDLEAENKQLLRIDSARVAEEALAALVS